MLELLKLILQYMIGQDGVASKRSEWLYARQ